MRRRLMPLACVVLLPHLACGGKPLDPTAGAGGGGRDGGGFTADGLPCSGDPKQDCVNGCVTGHVLSTRVCQDGAWVCPIGTNPTADCAGTADCPPSGGGACSDGRSAVIYNAQCSNGVWHCPAGTRPVVPAADAGAPDTAPDAAAPVPCPGDPFSCAIGTRGGWCGDVTWFALCVNGAFVCAGGLVPLAECRCSGPTPPGCVCGDAGLTCPSDAGAGTDADADAD